MPSERDPSRTPYYPVLPNDVLGLKLVALTGIEPVAPCSALSPAVPNSFVYGPAATAQGIAKCGFSRLVLPPYYRKISGGTGEYGNHFQPLPFDDFPAGGAA